MACAVSHASMQHYLMLASRDRMVPHEDAYMLGGTLFSQRVHATIACERKDHSCFFCRYPKLYGKLSGLSVLYILFCRSCWQLQLQLAPAELPIAETQPPELRHE